MECSYQQNFCRFKIHPTHEEFQHYSKKLNLMELALVGLIFSLELKMDFISKLSQGRKPQIDDIHLSTT